MVDQPFTMDPPADMELDDLMAQVVKTAPATEAAPADSAQELVAQESAEPAVKHSPLVDRAVQTRPHQNTSGRSSSDTMVVPPATIREVNMVVGERDDDSTFDNEWGEALKDGMRTVYHRDSLTPATLREDSQWAQTVASPAGGLTADYRRIGAFNPATASIETINAYVRQQRGLGGVINVPLWHSGLWIRIAPPEEYDMVDLYHTFSQRKIQAGRFTNGMAFGHMTAFTNEDLFSFVMSHVQSTSLKLDNLAELPDYISMLDLKPLIGALACAQYPNGFAYERACVASGVDGCNYVLRESLDVPSLYWVDEKKLSRDDIIHMSNRKTGSQSPQSVRDYQARNYSFLTMDEVIDDTLTLRFKIPMVMESFKSAHRWLDLIEELSTAAIQEEGDARVRMITDKSRASILRQWAHLVDAAIISGVEINTPAKIESLLNTYSADDEVRSKIHKAAIKFINDRIISMIAIKTYTCPACGKPQRHAEHDVPHPDLIPLDPTPIFFQLGAQRLTRMRSR